MGDRGQAISWQSRAQQRFYIGCADINATRQIVLYPGSESFMLDAKTEVMPLSKVLSEVGG